MAKKSAQLKAQAKEQIRGRWLQIIIATFVVMVISVALGLVLGFIPVDETKIGLFITVQFVGMIIAIIVVAPLSYGLIAYTLKFIRHQDVEISEVFSGYNRVKDSVILNLLINLFVTLWMMPFVIVFIIMLTMGIISTVSGVGPSPLIVFLGIVVYIAMIVVGTIKSLSYSMSYYILAENSDMRASEALNWSKRITKGHKGRMFYIGLSFIGWSILAAITIGIGLIWLVPYINVTMANLYVDIKELNPEYNAIVPIFEIDTPNEENNQN